MTAAGRVAFGEVAARVSEARLWQRHEDLARFGATARGGVNRQALSAEEIAARRQILLWAEELGLTPATDDAGNLFLRWAGQAPELPPVLVGSHIDSQPTGGKYDGAFGVLAALEAVAAMREAGVAPHRPLEIVAWMNEEGSRFAPGMMGSEAFAGVRPLPSILAVTDRAGETVGEALASVAAAFPDVPSRQLGFPVAAFIEAHIEQGPDLELAGRAVGVVTGIQGKKTFRVQVSGEEAHAGTTPRRRRRDAVRSAAGIIDALHRRIMDEDDIVRFTVGRLLVEPNAPSVVPGRASFSIDLRHPGDAELTRFGAMVAECATEFAGACTVVVEPLVDATPLKFPSVMQNLIRSTATRLGIASMDLPSAAGHDARNLHRVCPTGMIFVPCEKGISHNEAEFAKPADLADGTSVLAEALLQLVSEALR